MIMFILHKTEHIGQGDQYYMGDFITSTSYYRIRIRSVRTKKKK
jgi:hypothetical protein